MIPGRLGVVPVIPVRHGGARQDFCGQAEAGPRRQSESVGVTVCQADSEARPGSGCRALAA
eukprot:3843678-Rhodomonas_salina.2